MSGRVRVRLSVGRGARSAFRGAAVSRELAKTVGSKLSPSVHAEGTPGSLATPWLRGQSTSDAKVALPAPGTTVIHETGEERAKETKEVKEAKETRTRDVSHATQNSTVTGSSALAAGVSASSPASSPAPTLGALPGVASETQGERQRLAQRHAAFHRPAVPDAGSRKSAKGSRGRMTQIRAIAELRDDQFEALYGPRLRDEFYAQLEELDKWFRDLVHRQAVLQCAAAARMHLAPGEEAKPPPAVEDDMDAQEDMDSKEAMSSEAPRASGLSGGPAAKTLDPESEAAGRPAAGGAEETDAQFVDSWLLHAPRHQFAELAPPGAPKLSDTQLDHIQWVEAVLDRLKRQPRAIRVELNYTISRSAGRTHGGLAVFRAVGSVADIVSGEWTQYFCRRYQREARDAEAKQQQAMHRSFLEDQARRLDPLCAAPPARDTPVAFDRDPEHGTKPKPGEPRSAMQWTSEIAEQVHGRIFDAAPTETMLGLYAAPGLVAQMAEAQRRTAETRRFVAKRPTCAEHPTVEKYSKHSFTRMLDEDVTERLECPVCEKAKDRSLPAAGTGGGALAM